MGGDCCFELSYGCWHANAEALISVEGRGWLWLSISKNCSWPDDEQDGEQDGEHDSWANYDSRPKSCSWPNVKSMRGKTWGVARAGATVVLPIAVPGSRSGLIVRPLTSCRDLHVTLTAVPLPCLKRPFSCPIAYQWVAYRGYWDPVWQACWTELGDTVLSRVTKAWQAV